MGGSADAEKEVWPRPVIKEAHGADSRCLSIAASAISSGLASKEPALLEGKRGWTSLPACPQIGVTASMLAPRSHHHLLLQACPARLGLSLRSACPLKTHSAALISVP